MPKEKHPSPHFPKPINGHSIPDFSLLAEEGEGVVYRFWSWHPRYRIWSKSCYHGATREKAWADLKNKSHENRFARVLVKERRKKNGNRTYKVVDTVTPTDLREWHR